MFGTDNDLESRIKELEVVNKEQAKQIRNYSEIFKILQEQIFRLIENPLDDSNKIYNFILDNTAKLLGFKRSGLMLVLNDYKNIPSIGTAFDSKIYLKTLALTGVSSEEYEDEINSVYKIANNEFDPTMWALKNKKAIQIVNNAECRKFITKNIGIDGDLYFNKMFDYYEKQKFPLSFDDFIRGVIFPIHYKNDCLGIINFDTPIGISPTSFVPEYIINSGKEILDMVVPLITYGTMQHEFADMIVKLYPRELVNMLLKNRSDFDSIISGKNREVSCFFADVSGYTSYSSGKQPQNITSFLKELNTDLSKIIRDKYDGFIVYRPGDAVLAIWNGIYDQEDYVKRAVNSAIEIQKTIDTKRKYYYDKFGIELYLKIGLSSGEVCIGNIGRANELYLTGIGPPINLCQRIMDSGEPGEINMESGLYSELNLPLDCFERKRYISVKNVELPVHITTINHKLVGEKYLQL